MDSLNLAEIIRQRRNEIGLTQSQVAAQLGFKSADYIYLVEQGLRSMDLDKIPALAETLRLNPVELAKAALESRYPVLSQCLLKSKDVRTVPVHGVPDVSLAVRHLKALPLPLRQLVINMITTLYEEQRPPQLIRRMA